MSVFISLPFSGDLECLEVVELFSSTRNFFGSLCNGGGTGKWLRPPRGRILKNLHESCFEKRRTSQLGPTKDNNTGKRMRPFMSPMMISADITTKKYFWTNSNSEKPSMRMPKRVERAPWMTGTNTRSIQAAIRSLRVPNDVRNAKTTCAVNSTPENMILTCYRPYQCQLR